MSSLDRWHNGHDIKAQESGRDCSNVLYAFRPSLVIANYRKSYKYQQRAKTPPLEAERGPPIGYSY
jgi:hypothetical protein